MDPRTPPTAAELGISDVEYERILRDLRRRRGEDQPPPPPSPPQRRSRRKPLAVLGVVTAVLLVSRLSTSDPEPEYAFLKTVHGQPVTYSSCRPLQVAVYPAGGPPDAEALVREAVDLLRSATGLDIVVSGVFGGYAPNWNFKAAPITPGDPISVSWQDGDAIAEMSDHTAGLGGSPVFTGPRGTERLAAGTIALSRQYYAVLAERGDHGRERAVLLHEFGHVFGLAHVGSKHEIMYKSVTDTTTYGPGDLEGLRRLGQGPCS
jgi:hypothetical protein